MDMKSMKANIRIDISVIGGLNVQNACQHTMIRKF